MLQYLIRRLSQRHIALDKFDIDLHDSHVKEVVNSYIASTFRNYRHRLHSHYKRAGNHKVACQKPYEGVSQEDWKMCCNRFYSKEFQKVSKKNSENRQLLKANHCAGSKSLVEYHHETNDMITLQSQPTKEDSPPLTDDEICKRVLDTRSGYVRGLGHGVLAPPSSSTGLQNNQWVEELTKNATAAKRQAQELTKQLQRMKVQMEALINKMEALINKMKAMMQSTMAQKMGTPPCQVPPSSKYSKQLELIKSRTSFLFDDMEPIITTPEEMERYKKIYLDFEMCLEKQILLFHLEQWPKKAKPMATSGESNTSTIIGTKVEQPREEDQPDIPSSPSEAL